MPTYPPSVLMLNAQIEVPIPLHRDQVCVRECFNVAMRSARGESHHVDHGLVSRYRSLEVDVRHPRDVAEDGSLTKATLAIN
jgi:hypothetical protein